ncbi:GyrI-like domain-containing protein [Crassaminicella profunda]|uniref:GyrI-like domain-containing protein n=1 Tax=Crassaminicella profunda TaxID=1286698 RepID=UPI001CA6959A|nr:GyrI-like domain-containing protein [Crassaminicella profunda]QZY56867.1 GyrI-like domain-containing protein [Crassaminicella profunda]
MKYEIIMLNEKIVVGIMKQTTNVGGQSVKDIGEVWQQFITTGIYEKIMGKVNHKAIGLYTDYEGDFTRPYDFLACCEVMDHEKLEGSLTKKVIPKGKYAKFIINGDVKEAVGQFWTKLWQLDLDRAYTCDFEEYQNNSQDMKNQEIHIYISLKE